MGAVEGVAATAGAGAVAGELAGAGAVAGELAVAGGVAGEFAVAVATVGEVAGAVGGQAAAVASSVWTATAMTRVTTAAVAALTVAANELTADGFRKGCDPQRFNAFHVNGDVISCSYPWTSRCTYTRFGQEYTSPGMITFSSGARKNPLAKHAMTAFTEHWSTPSLPTGIISSRSTSPGMTPEDTPEPSPRSVCEANDNPDPVS